MNEWDAVSTTEEPNAWDAVSTTDNEWDAVSTVVEAPKPPVPFIDNRPGPNKAAPEEAPVTTGEKIKNYVSKTASGLKDYASAVKDVGVGKVAESALLQAPSEITQATSDLAQFPLCAGNAVGAAVSSIAPGNTVKNMWEKVKEAWSTQSTANKIEAVTEKLKDDYLKSIDVGNRPEDILANPLAYTAAQIATVVLPADLGATATVKGAKAIAQKLTASGIKTAEQLKNIEAGVKGAVDHLSPAERALVDELNKFKGTPSPAAPISSSEKNLLSNLNVTKSRELPATEVMPVIKPATDVGAPPVSLPETVKMPVVENQQKSINVIDKIPEKTYIKDVPEELLRPEEGIAKDYVGVSDTKILQRAEQHKKLVQDPVVEGMYRQGAANELIDYLKVNKIPFTYGRGDGRNLTGWNKFNKGVHEATNDQMKQVWGIYAQEVRNNGGLIARDSDEFKIIFPNKTVDEVNDIWDGIDSRVSDKIKELGLDAVPTGKGEYLGLPVPTGHIDAGFVDGLSKPTIADVDKSADALAEIKKRQLYKDLKGAKDELGKINDQTGVPTGNKDGGLGEQAGEQMGGGRGKPSSATQINEATPGTPEGVVPPKEPPVVSTTPALPPGEKMSSVSRNLTERFGLWQGEPKTYKVKSHAENKAKVEELIQSEGPEALRVWVNDGKAPAAEKILTSGILSKHYDSISRKLTAQAEAAAEAAKPELLQRAKDAANASDELARKMADLGTEYGQGIEAIKQVYENLSDKTLPIYLERLVNNFNGKTKLLNKTSIPLTEAEAKTGTAIAESQRITGDIADEIKNIITVAGKVQRKEKLSPEDIAKLKEYNLFIKGSAEKVEKTAKPRVKILKGADAILARGHASLDAAEAAVRERIAARKLAAQEQAKVATGEKPGITELHAGLTPKDVKASVSALADDIELGAILVGKGLVNLAEWSKAMGEEFINRADLPSLFEKSKAQYRSAVRASRDLQKHQKAIGDLIKTYEEVPANVISPRTKALGAVLSDDEAKKQFIETLIQLKKSGEQLGDEQTAMMQQFINEARIARMTGVSKISAGLKSLIVNNMVSSTLSHAANISGNAVALVLRDFVVKPVSIAVEKTTSKLSGKVSQAYWGEIFNTHLGAKNFIGTTGIGNAFDGAIKGFKGIGNKWLEQGNVAVLPKALTLPTKALGFEDGLFKGYIKSTVTGELIYREARRTVKSNEKLGDRIAELYENTPAWITERAEKEALDWTWQSPFDENSIFDNFAKSLMDFRNKTGPLGILTVPFIKTPYMLFKFSMKATPYGLISGVNKYKKGLIDSEEFANQAALAIVGSTALSGMVWSILNGKVQITGQAPKDKAQAKAFYSAKMAPYAIKVGDMFLPISRLEPVASSIGLAADLAQAIKNNSIGREWYDPEIWLAAGAAVSQNMTSKLWWQSIANISDAIKSTTDENKWAKLAGKFGGSLVPYSGALGNINRADDLYMRDPKGLIEQMKSQLPILSRSIIEKQDIVGQNVERPGNALTKSISPAIPQKRTENKVIIETAKTGAAPEGVKRKLTITEITKIPEAPTNYDSPNFGQKNFEYLNKLNDLSAMKALFDKVSLAAKQHSTKIKSGAVLDLPPQYYKFYEQRAGRYYEKLVATLLRSGTDRRNDVDLGREDRKILYKIYKELIPQYSSLPNERKAEILESLSRTANAMARRDLVEKMSKNMKVSELFQYLKTPENKPVLEP